MAEAETYQHQAQLLVQVLPFVAQEAVFGLKGGTAINLFLRPMPRLSVDIDLTYLPIADREQSLTDCRRALTRIAEHLESTSPQIATAKQMSGAEELRLLISTDSAQIKVEVSPVLRGTIHPPQQRDIHPEVEEQFGFASMAVLAEPDWSLLELDGVAELPAVQWKLENIRKMQPEKHKKAIERLESVLENLGPK